ncbi:MAG: hypothetical protein ACOX2F_01100 [bacterium]
MRKLIIAMIALSLLFGFVACGDDPVPFKPDESNSGPDDGGNTDSSDTDSSNTDSSNTDSSDTGNSASDDSGDTGSGDDGCATENMGTGCETDNDCGKCMICATGGKCVKGCTTDGDCTMHTGLKCNKKLGRCTNVFASSQACNEAKCPTGCCYGEKGLTGVKCLTTPEASKCGFCPQGEIYIPDDSKCVAAVCSATTDNCPTLNSGSSSPKPSCFECKSGEFICQANTSTSGCSGGAIVNAAKCTPAGQQCVAGVSECCSGMPCIQGYCY